MKRQLITLFSILIIAGAGALLFSAASDSPMADEDRSIRTYESTLYDVDTATTTKVIAWDNQSTEVGTITWYSNVAHATASRSVILIHQEAVDFDKTVWFTVDTLAVVAQNGNYKGKDSFTLTGRGARLIVKSDSSTVPLTAGDFGFVFKPG
jgi:hypothetical protein